MHSISVSWPITWNDGMRCHWINVSATSCSHWQHSEQWPPLFCCDKAYGLYPLFKVCEMQRFSRIIHDRVLPVLFGYRKNSAAALDCIFSRFLIPLENVWFIVTKWLACHHSPATTVSELWQIDEASWIAHAIQLLYNSVPIHNICYCCRKWLF